MQASEPDELWQAYSEQGEPAGKVTLEQARAGVLHGASHIWIWRHEGDSTSVLLQQRAESSLTWPSFFDVSAAGHIDYGETPLQAAVRETNEELGVNVAVEQLQLLFAHRQRAVLVDSKVIEHEVQWVYGLQLNADEHFSFAHSEIDALRWISLDELKRLSALNEVEAKLVPHGPVYFAELFRAIELLK